MERWREAEAQPFWKRLAWMAAIWVASVAVLGVIAELLRVWLG
jgi:putative copper export protein